MLNVHYRNLYLVLALAVPASGAEYRFAKQVVPAELKRELVRNNFDVEHITCAGIYCALALGVGETKDPQPIIDAYVYNDPETVRAAILNELAEIEIRLDDGTATAADLRRAIKLLLRLHKLNRRP